MRDQPYGVVIESLIRGRVDARRQPCPTKRLTPMGLSAGENARGLCDFRRNIGHIPQRVYMGVRKKHANKPLGLVFWQSRVKVHSALTLFSEPLLGATP